MGNVSIKIVVLDVQRMGPAHSHTGLGVNGILSISTKFQAGELIMVLLGDDA